MVFQHIEFFTKISNFLIISVKFNIVVHRPQHFLLLISGTLLQGKFGITCVMIRMGRLPRLRALKAKGFATLAHHINGTFWSLHNQFAWRASPCVFNNPVNVCILMHCTIYPFITFLTAARIMIVHLTPKAEDFTTCILHCTDWDIRFYTIVTIDPSTEGIIFFCLNKRFADISLQSIEQLFTIVSIKCKYLFGSFVKNRASAIIIDAF